MGRVESEILYRHSLGDKLYIIFKMIISVILQVAGSIRIYLWMMPRRTVTEVSGDDILILADEEKRRDATVTI